MLKKLLVNYGKTAQKFNEILKKIEKILTLFERHLKSVQKYAQ